jgi:AcrR family transcriptional regulator
LDCRQEDWWFKMETNLTTKQQLLVAATNLLDQGGPSAVTLRAVGDKVGVSQTAPYRHFRDKRDLLEAIARESFNEVSEILRNALRKTNSPLGALRLAVEEYLDLARRYPLRHRLLFDIAEEGGLEPEAQRAFESIQDLVVAAQRTGELHDGDPSRISALICSTVHGLAKLQRLGEGKAASVLKDADALSMDFVDLIAAGSGEFSNLSGLN